MQIVSYFRCAQASCVPFSTHVLPWENFSFFRSSAFFSTAILDTCRLIVSGSAGAKVEDVDVEVVHQLVGVHRLGVTLFCVHCLVDADAVAEVRCRTRNDSAPTIDVAKLFSTSPTVTIGWNSWRTSYLEAKVCWCWYKKKCSFVILYSSCAMYLFCLISCFAALYMNSSQQGFDNIIIDINIWMLSTESVFELIKQCGLILFWSIQVQSCFNINMDTGQVMINHD